MQHCDGCLFDIVYQKTDGNFNPSAINKANVQCEHGAKITGNIAKTLHEKRMSNL